MTYLEFFGTMLAFSAIVLGGVKAMLYASEKRAKEDSDALWERVHNHYHEIECGNKQCTALHTGNVIIPRGSK